MCIKQFMSCASYGTNGMVVNVLILFLWLKAKQENASDLNDEVSTIILEPIKPISEQGVLAILWQKCDNRMWIKVL